MTVDVWFVLGGVLGAVVRRLRAKDEGNDFRLYVVDAAIAALGGPLLSSLAGMAGVGQDILASLTTNPLRAIAVGAIPAYVGLDLLTMASTKLRGVPTTESVKQIVAESKPTPAEAKEISAVATVAAKPNGQA